MPHISRKRTSKDTYLKIYDQLISAVRDSKSSSDAKSIAHGLFTKTERIMLAKRLALIILIHEGESSYTVLTQLKISTSTYKRIYKNYEGGMYRSLLTNVKKTFVDDLFQFVGGILASGRDTRKLHKLLD